MEKTARRTLVLFITHEHTTLLRVSTSPLDVCTCLNFMARPGQIVYQLYC